ncbi:protein krueppel-like [Ruditapes philippinarum]|uniref:protein krueppel-like n=1 Tax=Ruditapes philippinarum TaxID=129788 RepID=UPI00295BA6FF|nr:protein krueppel-like [Ruditapes philippinarum]
MQGASGSSADMAGQQGYNSENDFNLDARGTGNDDIQKPSLKHVCPICSRPFPSSSGLSRHLLTHTGEKPFECEVCGKRFNRKGNMRTHMLVHLQALKN